VALLAYLVVTRQRHSRDALATLLWPEYDQAHARATLRHTLSVLGKALGGQWLDIEREVVGLNSGADTWSDVDEFTGRLAKYRAHGHGASEMCPTCLRDLSKAVKVYRDDFLAGFSLRDSANFDDWQFFQADSLRRELANT